MTEYEMTKDEKQQMFRELQSQLMNSKEIDVSISQDGSELVFHSNDPEKNSLLLDLLKFLASSIAQDTSIDKHTIKKNENRVNVKFNFMQTDCGIKMRHALPLLVTLQSLKNESKTTEKLHDKESVVSKTLTMVEAIICDKNCTIKAAKLTFEAFHQPIKSIAKNTPLKPKEFKAFNDKVHHAAREGKMADSTKTKIAKALGAVGFILFGLTILAAIPPIVASAPVSLPFAITFLSSFITSIALLNVAFHPSSVLRPSPETARKPIYETTEAMKSIQNCVFFNNANNNRTSTAMSMTSSQNTLDFNYSKRI